MADDLRAVDSAEKAAKQLGLPFVRLTPNTPVAEALALIPETLAREYRVIPVTLDPAAKSLTVAVGDPSLLAQPAPSFLQELKQQQGFRLILELTPATDFEAALGAYARPEAENVKRKTQSAKPNEKPKSEPPSSSQPPEKVPASVHSAQLPAVDLATKTIPRATLERFPEDVARKFGMVVFELSADGKEASVAVTKADDPRVRDILKFVQARNGVRIHLFSTDRKSLDAALAQYGRQLSAVSPQPSVANAKRPPAGEAGKTQHAKPSAKPTNDGKNVTPSSMTNHQSPIPAPTVPVKQASADTVRKAAQTPASPVPPPAPKPSSHSTPVVPVPMVSAVGASAVPAGAVGGVRPAPTATSGPAQSASDYQAQVTRNSSAAPLDRELGVERLGTSSVQAPVVKANVPMIDAAELVAPAVLAGAQAGGVPTPSPAAVLPQMEERNLDAILGGQITDVNGLETAIKTGLIPKVVASVLAYAVNLGASDVHVEAEKGGVRVRYRVDGKLAEIIRLPQTLLAPFVSRIKILAKLKIDESRVPQDGRFDVEAAGRQIDLRVSTLPTVFGEKVVLRLLDKAAGLKSLDELGITGTNLTRVRSVIDAPFGIILVTGPTGSGKTTTLYAMLSEVNTPDVNIVTLEDPVEYQVDGINQTQVRSKIGFGFADGLRSILRQDPNIIMVGEIRDKETAALATQAALTGHLVLATLHTNDAAGAIPRMLDMGVEPFLLASSVRAVIAQRLVRQLIPETRVAWPVPPEELEAVKASLAAGKAPEVKAAASQPLAFLGAKPDAPGGGYKGRVGIYEILTVSEAIAALTLQKAAGAKIAATALAEGMVTLRQDGILKALSGQTSLGEVLQATAE